MSNNYNLKHLRSINMEKTKRSLLKEEKRILDDAYKLADEAKLSDLNPRQSIIEFLAYFFKLVELGKASFGYEIKDITLRRMRGAVLLLIEELQSQENQDGKKLLTKLNTK